jgi:hypothetical protein
MYTSAGAAVNRPQRVAVRAATGALLARVALAVANRLLTEHQAAPIYSRGGVLRYVRLLPGATLRWTAAGWAVAAESRRPVTSWPIPKQRDRFGDAAVVHGIRAFERGDLHWQVPAAR